MKKYERLFITLFENASKWTGGKREVIDLMRDEDMVLCFKRNEGSSEPENAVKSILDSINIQYLEEYGKTKAEFYDDILKIINAYTDEETEIYFLEMNKVAEDLKKRILTCRGIGIGSTLRVGRVILKKNGLTVEKRKIPQKGDIQDSSGKNAADVTTENKESGKNNGNEPQSSENEKEEIRNSLESKAPETEEDILVRIERQQNIILGLKQKPKPEGDYIREREKNKAVLLYFYFCRFIRHFRENTDESMELSLDEYTMLVHTLAMNSDLNKFSRIWEQSRLPIRWKTPEDEKFLATQTEASFYVRFCRFLYEEDIWKY